MGPVCGFAEIIAGTVVTTAIEQAPLRSGLYILPWQCTGFGVNAVDSTFTFTGPLFARAANDGSAGSKKFQASISEVLKLHACYVHWVL